MEQHARNTLPANQLEFEQAAMAELCFCAGAVGDVIRQQYLAATVVERWGSGAGFYTDFDVPSSVDRLPPDTPLTFGYEVRDRTSKKRIYAEAGVCFLWLVDPRLQLLEAFELRDGHWTDVGTWNSAEIVRAPPFDAISFPLADLWPLDPPLGMNEDPTPFYAGDR